MDPGDSRSWPLLQGTVSKYPPIYPYIHFAPKQGRPFFSLIFNISSTSPPRRVALYDGRTRLAYPPGSILLSSCCAPVIARYYDRSNQSSLYFVGVNDSWACIYIGSAPRPFTVPERPNTINKYNHQADVAISSPCSVSSSESSLVGELAVHLDVKIV